MLNEKSVQAEENAQPFDSKVCFCTGKEDTEGLMGRCFMNGEQCPHKKRIIDKRKQRHENGELRIFVVMSFSPITDAIYTWLLKALIKKERKNFLLDGREIDMDKIKIIRSDDVAYNSHMVCESICSAIQEADLIVVDFSYQNPNVFYEFGLAIALGKKILPICYKGSYYEYKSIFLGEWSEEKWEKWEKHVAPYIGLEKAKEKNDQYLIEAYPRKKHLLEFYSLSSKGSEIKGIRDSAVEIGAKYGLPDFFESYPFTGPEENRNVGKSLHLALQHSLDELDNLLIYDPQLPANRVQVDIGRKINAFSDIVEKMARGKRKAFDPANWHEAKNYIALHPEIISVGGNGAPAEVFDDWQIENRFVPQDDGARDGNEKEIFVSGLKRRGDQILFLFSQKSMIPDADKDRAGSKIPYSFGDIGRLAVNQANCNIERGYNLSEGLVQKGVRWSSFIDIGQSSYNQVIENSVRGHNYKESPKEEQLLWHYIYNRTETQDMDYPLYVDTVRERLFPELNFLLYPDLIKSDDYQTGSWSFTNLDIIMANAQNCQSAFIDMRGNRIEALFWMGMFHGRGRFVIPIHYNASPENETIKATAQKRVVADILGLWNAYFQSNDLGKFSAEVEKVLNSSYAKEGHLRATERAEFLQALGLWRDAGSGETLPKEEGNWLMAEEPRLQADGKATEKESEANARIEILEKYYHKMFWNVMLAHSDVALYPSTYPNTERPYISLWDCKAGSMIEQFTNRQSWIYRAVLKAAPPVPSKGDKESGEERSYESPSNTCIALGSRRFNGMTCLLLNKIENLKGQLGEFRKDSADDKSGPAAVENAEQGFYLTGENGESKAEWLTKEEDKEPGVEHSLYGQMTFYRKGRNQYFVLLEGASGPATYGMATLLQRDINTKIEYRPAKRSNEPQQDEAKNEGDSRSAEQPVRIVPFFSVVQGKMLEECSRLLQDAYQSAVEQEGIVRSTELNKVFAMTGNYLMLCLCERFLPVMSQNFVENLDARAHLYLKLLQRDLEGAAYQNCFPAIAKILQIWFRSLSNIRGMAVILESKFVTETSDIDDRIVKSIDFPKAFLSDCFRVIRRVPE